MGTRNTPRLFRCQVFSCGHRFFWLNLTNRSCFERFCKPNCRVENGQRCWPTLSDGGADSGNVFKLAEFWGAPVTMLPSLADPTRKHRMGRRAATELLNRRDFLKQIGYASPVLLPAPIRLAGGWHNLTNGASCSFRADSLAEFRLTPAYPARSPLEAMLQFVAPGTDSYVTEKHAAEIQLRFESLRELLTSQAQVRTTGIAGLLHETIQGNELVSAQEVNLRSEGGIELRRRNYPAEASGGEKAMVASQLEKYLAALGPLDIAEFELVSVKQRSGEPLEVDAQVRYSLVAARPDRSREQRIGLWRMSWRKGPSGEWLATRWLFTQETVARVAKPLFEDTTTQALGGIASYHEQMRFGADHWRTVLEGASGVDVYGNNGIATGDYDGDGRDDIYICQPSGLPNRLYRNRGDGTFEDLTERAGVGVLDPTSCAIFADFQNRGLQDLLVVCNSGPLLFLNQGNGTFVRKTDAFTFAKPPEGTFTHAAVGDYDRDGRLDIYFCLYTYYLGLDQYHYPSPYFDARNGPPNYLFHNEGNSTFVDHTEAAGLNIENDRFSFACAWGDTNGNGLPDLYVANDFGRSNLYRNDGNGKFTAVSDSSGSNDVGAGMSACWLDFDNDGKQDIYVSNMWSAAGQRISEQENFHPADSENLKSFYRQHAAGNSLYKNLGDGNFKNVAVPSGTSLGRWAWSSDSWDFDHDGFSDLYVANGYISGTQPQDLSSFFWRQVVGNSPATFTPSAAYERGWNAINELIRSDHSWSGYERNSLFLNNHDGTFFDVSGISGLDFLDDSRAFALADINHDGRLEVILKNRTAPQLRILQNAMQTIGNSVCFCLRGVKSNRDAIGASITIQCGNVKQTKYLQAGTGFLSQHS